VWKTVNFVPLIINRNIWFLNSVTVPIIPDRTTRFPNSDYAPWLKKNYLEWEEEEITTERKKLMQKDTEKNEDGSYC
jgi:hypothetical protein